MTGFAGTARQIRRGRRLAAAALMTTTLLTASSCATLPTSTEPHVLRPFEQQDGSMPEFQPREGMEPDLLLRDFYAATANPTGNFESARRYLTGAMSQAWAPGDTTFVLDSIALTSRASTDQAKRSYTVSGKIIGYLLTGGSFVPENKGYEATLELVQENGQWRVSGLPNEAVVERSDLRNYFEPRNLYFYDSSGQALISDRRWVYSRVPSLGSALMTMLVDGPTEVLAPAVSPSIPESVAFTGVKDGIYEFTGLAGADQQTRARFAAQVVWTLHGAGVVGPYSVRADGAPLVGDSKELTTDQFDDLNPVREIDEGPPLYTLSGGAVSAVRGLDGDSETTVESVSVSDQGRISQIDIGDDGNYASTVNISDTEQSLVVGTIGEGSKEVLRAGSLTRPTLESNHTAAWVVIDGERVVRVDRSAATGQISTSDVELNLPPEMAGEITVLRLSATGARVAMIIDGHVVVGVVERREDGSRAIVNVARYAPELNGAAVSADWQPDLSLLVGTSSQDRPVVRLEQDGSSTTVLPSGNVTGPVVAVGGTTQMMYITDSNVILRMPVLSRDTVNWREVPGQQGVRAAPVVPRP